MKVWIRKEAGTVCQVHYSTVKPVDSSPGEWSEVESDSQEVLDFKSLMESKISKVLENQQKRNEALNWLAGLTTEQRNALIQ